MKTKFACCDLTENLAAFEARNTISSNFRFRLQDLPKIIARNQFVKPIKLTRFFLKVTLMNSGNKSIGWFSVTSCEFESFFKL